LTKQTIKNFKIQTDQYHSERAHILLCDLLALQRDNEPYYI